eukprot:tig00020723_g13518.t1
MDEDAFDVFHEGSSRKGKRAVSGPEDGVGKRARTQANGDNDEIDAAEGPLKPPTRPVFKSSVPAGLQAPETAVDLSQLDESDPVKKIPVNPSSRCIHEVSKPPEVDVFAKDRRTADKEPPRETQRFTEPAKTYPFPVDAFQIESIKCLERGESVLVSAHTSAGKTVVAQYAVAMSLRAKQRVIYTSPIKALSNQKYRELFEEFQDVGLMTGDVTINPNAGCLVMTTEILRSMLYRGSEVMREVAWIIFDEIHYMRDRERGVVWEESIILVPDKVRFVFLSATIPNAKEFADWIAKVHYQPCHVVYTDYRPTPLQHYIFPAGGDGLFLVVDEKSNFREDNFQKALASLQEPSQKPGFKKGRKGGGPGPSGSDIYKIVKMIMERSYQPVIVFSFSKKECEALALQMAKLDFNDEDEKKLVETVFNNAIDSLSEDDKHIPQVEHILPLLKRGIGIHHSGLLPILKEVIEILFQEGLLKALFATETFSIGLNMPAKTVVFTSVRKFDGENFRWVSGGEYIQMSGRAGRRGLDDRGIVILMVDEKMEPAVAKGMLMGQADPLTSSFHLGYNMLLNLMRVEEADPDYVIRRSFGQFQSDRQIPQLQSKLSELEAERDAVVVPGEETVAEYAAVLKQFADIAAEIREWTTKPLYALPFLQPGRLVRVKDARNDWGWGVVINFTKKGDAGAEKDAARDAVYVVDALLKCAVQGSSAVAANARPRPCPAGEAGDWQVVPLLLALVADFSQVRVMVPKDLRPAEARANLGKTVAEVMRRFPDGLPLLNPVTDMNIQEPSFKKLYKRLDAVQERLGGEAAFKAPDMKERLAAYERKMELDAQCKAVKKEMKQSSDIIFKEELRYRRRVLRRLGFASGEGVVEVKGRVACEVSTADELLATELLFNGVFNELQVEQCVALCSCLVYQEKSKETTRLREELAAPLRILQEAARRIASVAQECKLGLDVEEYVQSFKPDMMEVVHAWCRGAKFADVCKMTEIFEGSIIRAMRRLEEFLRQMVDASKAIGNEELVAKFEAGIAKLKRDIVFAASLYL